MGDFFNESVAKSKGMAEILLVGIPISHFSRNENNGLMARVCLPSPTANLYTNTNAGRVVLETPQNKEGFSSIINLKKGEKERITGLIRCMSGGLICKLGDAFVLQSKYYPRSGDRYFSCFTGLSGSFDEIANPNLIIPREGLEEFLIKNSKTGTIYVPNINYSPVDLTSKKVQSIGVTFGENKDIIVVEDYKGEVLSTTPCILDVNPDSNSVDLVKIMLLPEDIPNIHFYEREFKNDVCLLSFDQIRSIWKDWRKNIPLKCYQANGELVEKPFPGLIDSLVQSAAMSMGIISGNTRTDYKTYGERSTF